MAKLVAILLENGGVILVEIDHVESGVVKAGRPGQIIRQDITDSKSRVGAGDPAARAIFTRLRETRPHAITMKLGLKLSAEAGPVATKTVSGCRVQGLAGLGTRR